MRRITGRYIRVVTAQSKLMMALLVMASAMATAAQAPQGGRGAPRLRQATRRRFIGARGGSAHLQLPRHRRVDSVAAIRADVVDARSQTADAGHAARGQHLDGPCAGNDLVAGRPRGYIVVTPMGYRGLSQPCHGSRYPIARVPAPSVPAAGWTPQEDERAEQDVLHVMNLVTRNTTSIHRACTARPSGSGALHLAAKYPERFAAVVVSSRPMCPITIPSTG